LSSHWAAWDSPHRHPKASSTSGSSPLSRKRLHSRPSRSWLPAEIHKPWPIWYSEVESKQISGTASGFFKVEHGSRGHEWLHYPPRVISTKLPSKSDAVISIRGSKKISSLPVSACPGLCFNHADYGQCLAIVHCDALGDGVVPLTVELLLYYGCAIPRNFFVL